MIVVDNSGGRLSAAAVHGLWPNATILVNDNRDFGPANQAASVAADDTLLFLNPDTRAEGEPLSAVARAFADLCVVAVAPRLDVALAPTPHDCRHPTLAP
jgi:hypothetical protein